MLKKDVGDDEKREGEWKDEDGSIAKNHTERRKELVSKMEE